MPEWEDSSRIWILDAQATKEHWQESDEKKLAALQASYQEHGPPEHDVWAASDGGIRGEGHKEGAPDSKRAAYVVESGVAAGVDREATSLRVSRKLVSFDTEVIGFIELLEHLESTLNNDGPWMVSMWVDNNGVLQSLLNASNRDAMTKLARDLLNQMQRRFPAPLIMIQWAPSHRGIHMNVLADILTSSEGEEGGLTYYSLPKRRVRSMALRAAQTEEAALAPPVPDDPDAESMETNLHRRYRVRKLGRIKLGKLVPLHQEVVLAVWTGESRRTDLVIDTDEGPQCAFCRERVACSAGGRRLSIGNTVVDPVIGSCPYFIDDSEPLRGRKLIDEVAREPRRYANRLLAAYARPARDRLPESWPHGRKRIKPLDDIPHTWQQQAIEGLENKRRRLSEDGSQEPVPMSVDRVE